MSQVRHFDGNNELLVTLQKQAIELQQSRVSLFRSPSMSSAGGDNKFKSSESVVETGRQSLGALSGAHHSRSSTTFSNQPVKATTEAIKDLVLEKRNT